MTSKSKSTTTTTTVTQPKIRAPSAPGLKVSLPSAAELVSQAKSAPDALKRQQKQTHVRELVHEYATYLIAQTEKVVPEFVNKGMGYAYVEAFKLSRYDDVEQPDGTVERRYQHEAKDTHFAGLDADPSQGGLPKVMLATGVYNRTTKKPEPKALAGGKCAIDLLREALPKDYRVAVTNVRGEFRIYVIWDMEAWDHRAALLKERAQQRSETRSLDDWKKEKQAKAAARAEKKTKEPATESSAEPTTTSV